MLRTIRVQVVEELEEVIDVIDKRGDFFRPSAQPFMWIQTTPRSPQVHHY